MVLDEMKKVRGCNEGATGCNERDLGAMKDVTMCKNRDLGCNEGNTWKTTLKYVKEKKYKKRGKLVWVK